MQPEFRALDSRSRREGGAALIVAVLMLALIGIIGLSSLDTVMRDRQAAGYSSQTQAALYAADAGIAEGLDILRREVLTAAVTGGDCLTTVLPNTTLGNQTSYRPDPTAATNQICMLASADPCAEMDASIEVGQPVYLYSIWNVRAEGRAPGGSTVRVHAAAERCHAFNN